MNDSLAEVEVPLLDINKVSTNHHVTSSSQINVINFKLGVDQPVLATKDIIIIVFMFMLWAYSLYLTYRAWYKLLYSDGEEGSNMWR